METREDAIREACAIIDEAALKKDTDPEANLLDPAKPLEFAGLPPEIAGKLEYTRTRATIDRRHYKIHLQEAVDLLGPEQAKAFLMALLENQRRFTVKSNGREAAWLP